MKNIQIQLNQAMMNLLKTMIGKSFKKYKCDPFIFTNKVYNRVGLYIDDSVFLLSNDLTVIDYFGEDEDISAFSIETTIDSKVVSGLKDTELIATPVEATIKEIRVIQEERKLFQHGVLTYNLTSTRGLIFVLEDDREISFEKADQYSEDIFVNRGHDLINKFQIIDDSNPEGDPNNEFKTTRTTLIIK